MARKRNAGGRRYTPPKTKLCPVCLTKAADTKEDILPDWARQRIRKLGVFEGGQVPSVLMPMCRDCNNGFGRLYENDAAPLVGPMIDGEARTLSPAEQEIVGLWEVKTSLLLALGHGVLSPTGRAAIRGLCMSMKGRRQAPHQSFVRIGMMDRSQPPDAEGHEDLHRAGQLPDTLGSGTAATGHVFFEVAFGDPKVLGSFVERCPDNEYLVRIWPPQLHDVEWPPQRGLVTRDLYALRLAWRERIWPPPANGRLPFGVGAHKFAMIVSPHPEGATDTDEARRRHT